MLTRNKKFSENLPAYKSATIVNYFEDLSSQEIKDMVEEIMSS
jgi:hypothetical protein